MKNKRMFLGISITMLALALTGCPDRKNIGEITSDPGRYHNKEVTIVGRVITSYGGFDKGVFQIDDGTGRMWVFSEKHGVPSKDAYVGVSGRIIPGVTYAGRNYMTVLRETKRRSRETK